MYLAMQKNTIAIEITSKTLSIPSLSVLAIKRSTHLIAFLDGH